MDRDKMEMKIIKRQDRKEVYTVIEQSKKYFQLVKVLNFYDNMDDALLDMFKVLDHKITEEELLQEYIKKDKGENYHGLGEK